MSKPAAIALQHRCFLLLLLCLYTHTHRNHPFADPLIKASSNRTATSLLLCRLQRLLLLLHAVHQCWLLSHLGAKKDFTSRHCPRTSVPKIPTRNLSIRGSKR